MRYVLAAALAFTLAVLLGTSPTADEQPSAQDAWKAAHAARVAAELEARDVSHLSPAQQRARLAMIDELIRYGTRGRFAQNEDFPGEAVPHLIDAHGTRCALANLIDVSGHEALLTRLAEQNNIAFAPELARDAELGAWLDQHGLTLEEAAYIQGPGFVDWQMPRDETPPGIPPTPSDRTGRVAEVEPEDAPTPTGLPAAPQTTDPERGTSGFGADGRPARRARAAALDWEQWWSLNRHVYLNLRARYHAGVVVTGRPSERRGWRPSDAELDATVMPLLERLATGDDRLVRTTALMAWARAARPRHAPAVIAAVRTYIADKDNAWRDVMLLALGIVRHADGVPLLAAIAGDEAEGRRALRKQGTVGLRARALALLALGQSGQADAVDPILGVLGDAAMKSSDVQASGVAALGALAGSVDAATRRRIGVFLVKALREGRWSDAALAQVPTALARAGDATLLLPTVQPALERFRKPTLVRQSGALAIGTLAPEANEGLVSTLIATARRDPDDAARRFGILALGELAAVSGTGSEREAKAARHLAGTLRRFYEGAFAGRNVQKTDMPWLCFSAALFGRGHDEHRAWVRKQLEHVVTSSPSKGREAAAVAALALLGAPRALPVLRTRYAQAKDKLTRAYLAEALGVLGDRSKRRALIDLVRTDGDAAVRYRAALGLGFSADAETLDVLLKVLGETSNQDAQVALSRVIGELGDRRALPALLALASNQKSDTWTRRRALAAIGMIGQAADHAWTTTYQRGVNFPAATPTLQLIHALY